MFFESPRQRVSGLYVAQSRELPGWCPGKVTPAWSREITPQVAAVGERGLGGGYALTYMHHPAEVYRLHF